MGKVADWTESTGWKLGSTATLNLDHAFSASVAYYSCYQDGYLDYSTGVLAISGTGTKR